MVGVADHLDRMRSLRHWDADVDVVGYAEGAGMTSLERKIQEWTPVVKAAMRWWRGTTLNVDYDLAKACAQLQNARRCAALARQRRGRK